MRKLFVFYKVDSEWKVKLYEGEFIPHMVVVSCTETEAFDHLAQLNPAPVKERTKEDILREIDEGRTEFSFSDWLIYNSAK